MFKALKCLFDHHKEPITPLANQLTNPIDASDNKDLKEKLRCKETETIELREELEEKDRSERLMKLRLQQTVEKLSLVQKDKMDLEQILHERMEPANQRRWFRRTKKASRQSIAEINRMSDAVGDTSHSLSHRRLQEPVRQTDRQRNAHNYSPDVTPFSSRKSSPIEETKQSPTESEGVGPALRGSHSSLSDIDTVTTVLDNSHIVDESLFERTEMDPGAPKLSLSHSRKKSFKRKSSIRRIVSSFRTSVCFSWSIYRTVKIRINTVFPISILLGESKYRTLLFIICFHSIWCEPPKGMNTVDKKGYPPKRTPHRQRFLVTEYILKHRKYPQQLPVIYVVEWKGVYSRFSIRIQILYGSPLHFIPTVHLNAALTSISTQEHHYQWEQEVSCWWNSLSLYSPEHTVEIHIATFHELVTWKIKGDLCIQFRIILQHFATFQCNRD